ncbi:tRNA-specific adenosine deaminase [Devosia pacifica]|uniref:tRNA-specific adenosine deaminase n=1 Tax=Devosia pacifica TaxID=1335967 RepID=A0A918VRU1_9HYPH|nr:nucleoside deaminase [Devosia pacifica]GHA17650.1 tRNA-specific adenosine deaminase [Devosia pacifica]
MFDHDITDLTARLLDVIEFEIAPKTSRGVSSGNKIFGAAILKKADLGSVVIETNNEMANPLWHGEMHAIKRYHELPDDRRPPPQDCVFLSTHEPCSLCISGITWAGFDNFFYLFSHEDSRDRFAIPHDIRILREVYAVPDPDRQAVPADRPLYNRENAFFTSRDLVSMIAALDRGNREMLLARVDNITALYADLSARYQDTKANNAIPLS